ncbi:RHS repeat-associated core domain-containing protein [Methylomonas sp. CM2]|uniref:RHS repeat-associated core domain-containing protein n=1 Tax=Methylomonas sp. CM2 TaxID=3417647 RepID=UPI003CED0AE6
MAGDLTQPISAWPIAPYGDTPALEDPDGDGAKTTFNLRYPGQYYDAFSGLHYNHTRYFSPHVGRYLQPDLIGLEGGTNVYTYANGNPVSYTDPTGTYATGTYVLEAVPPLFESFGLASMISDFTSAIGNAFSSIGSFGATMGLGLHSPGLNLGEQEQLGYWRSTYTLTKYR